MEINKINSNYSIKYTQDNYEVNGQLTYSNKINSLSCTILLDGLHLGNLHYSEDGECNIHYSVNPEHIDNIHAILKTIINNIKAQIV